MNWSEKKISEIEENDIFLYNDNYYECIQKGKANLLVANLKKYIKNPNDSFIMIKDEMYRKEISMDDDGFEYFPALNIRDIGDINVLYLSKEQAKWK